MSPAERLLALGLPEPDEGIITSGSCDTPEAQAWFDLHQKGKPPL